MLRKAIILCAALYAGASQASIITSTSGNGFDVTSVGASTIGGIVVDLLGTNGSHVVSQLAASTLFEGFYSVNPGEIGLQTGFSAGVLNALGGGLDGVSIRFTLWDGDTAINEFDYQENTLLVNGLSFGDWSEVDAEQTDSSGNAIGASSGGGFRDDVLDTGWFTNTDSSLLASLFNSLTLTNELKFELDDVDFGDNYIDFTQGIDQSLLDVGQGPAVTKPNPNLVSAPSSITLAGLVMLSMIGFRRSGK